MKPTEVGYIFYLHISARTNMFIKMKNFEKILFLNFIFFI